MTGQYNEDEVSDSIPNDYYGISFDEWYEMFLEYAFVVSGQGDSSEAYDVLAAAADASVWYHSKDKVRQIHICWISKLTFRHFIKRLFHLTNDMLKHVLSECTMKKH